MSNNDEKKISIDQLLEEFSTRPPELSDPGKRAERPAPLDMPLEQPRVEIKAKPDITPKTMPVVQQKDKVEKPSEEENVPAPDHKISLKKRTPPPLIHAVRKEPRPGKTDVKPQAPPPPPMGFDEGTGYKVRPPVPGAIPISLEAFDSAYVKHMREVRARKRDILINARFRRLKAGSRLRFAHGDTSVPNSTARRLGRDPGIILADLKKKVRALGIKTSIAFVLALGLGYLAIATQVFLPLPKALIYIESPYYFLAANLITLALVMIMGAEVMTAGFLQVVLLRPRGEALVAVACLAGFAHVFTVIMFPAWGGYLPYTAVCALSMFFSLWGLYIKNSAILKSLRSIVKAKAPRTVVMLEKAYNGQNAYFKIPASGIEKFLQGLDKPDFSEKALAIFAPVALVASVVLAIFACVSNQAGTLFPLFLSAMTSVAASAGCLVGYVLPCRLLASRLLRQGVAVGGIDALSNLSSDGFAVLNEGDFFPGESVKINGYKLFNGFSGDKAITCITSVLYGAGVSTVRPFLTLAQMEFCPIKKMSFIELDEYGGIRGKIDNDYVLVGTGSYMYRNGIHPPEGINLRNALFCAVNMELAAVFMLDYTADDSVLRALRLFAHSKRKPVLASKDFNVTPTMVDARYKLKPGMIDYPSIESRIELNEKRIRASGQSGVLLLRDSAENFAEILEGFRRLKTVSLANFILGAMCSTIGALIMFYLAYTLSFSAMSPLNILIYFGAWALPVLLLSWWTVKY